jgi:hypothetical protein
MKIKNYKPGQVPSEFLEIVQDNPVVSLLCNIGTLEKPYLEERIFPREPFEDMIKGWPEYPVNKFCMIEYKNEPGKMSITFTPVEGTEEFKRNFIKEDYFKDMDLSWMNSPDDENTSKKQNL